MTAPSKIKHIARLLFRFQEMRIGTSGLPFYRITERERHYWLARAHEYLLVPAAKRLNLWALFFNRQQRSSENE